MLIRRVNVGKKIVGLDVEINCMIFYLLCVYEILLDPIRDFPAVFGTLEVKDLAVPPTSRFTKAGPLN